MREADFTEPVANGEKPPLIEHKHSPLRLGMTGVSQDTPFPRVVV